MSVSELLILGLGGSAEALAAGAASLLSSSASMGPHVDVTQVFPDHMRMLFTGLPPKVQGEGRCCSLYVAFNTVNVFWRWQALLFPFREYVESFSHAVVVSENGSFWGKDLDKCQRWENIPRLTGSKVGVFTRALDSVSETIKAPTLVLEN